MDRIELFEYAPIALVFKDAKNRILRVNAECAKLLETPRDQLEGRSWLEFLPQDLADMVIAYDNEVMQTGREKRNIIENIVVNGKKKTCRIDKIPLLHRGETTGVISFILDITEQFKLESYLDNLRTAVECSPSVIVVTDLDTNITYVNPKFVEVTGYLSAEVIGRKTRLLKSGKVEQSVYTQMWEKLNRRETWRGEFLNRKKGGKLYWELAAIAPVINKFNNVVGYVKVAESIEDLKHTVFNLWNVFDMSNYYAVILDDNMRIKMCNKLLTKVLGYTSSGELYGKDWLDFIHRNDRSTIRAVHKSVVMGNGPDAVKEFINEIVSSDGQVHLIKWLNTNINGEYNWSFSVGVPFGEISEDDRIGTIETVRNNFQSLLSVHKALFDQIKREGKEKK